MSRRPLQRFGRLALRFRGIVANRSREPHRISDRLWFCQNLRSRATHSRAIAFCYPCLETSVQIVRPTHLFGMTTEPTLTICLDASEICELTGRTLCLVKLVS